jgi:hypothetical protein
MAHVGRRRVDSARHFLLGQVKLTASLANHSPESTSSGFRHAGLFPEPVARRKRSAAAYSTSSMDSLTMFFTYKK